jgi:hypothetical protein
MTLADAGWITFALGFVAFASGYALLFALLALARLRDPDAKGANLSLSLARRMTPARRAARADGERTRDGGAGRIADRLLQVGTLLLAISALVFLADWARQ